MKKLYFLIFFISVSFGFSQNDIFDACRKGNVNDVISIYTKDTNSINKPNDTGYTPLILACYHGNEDVVKFLIDKVQDINGSSDYGSPLMAAVVKGNKNIVEMLLNKNADANIADTNGTTALHYAVMFKNYDIIKLLIEANADINLKDNRDKSAIEYAKLLNDKKIINLLNNQL